MESSFCGSRRTAKKAKKDIVGERQGEKMNPITIYVIYTLLFVVVYAAVYALAPSSSFLWLRWIIAILIAGPFLFWSKERWPSFDRIFRFRPTRRPELKRIEQEKVDNVLESLASNFKLACDLQERAIKNIQPNLDPSLFSNTDEFNKSLQRDKKRLAKNAKDIKKHKRIFWWAHEVAKKHGYNVLSSHHDYLA